MVVLAQAAAKNTAGKEKRLRADYGLSVVCDSRKTAPVTDTARKARHQNDCE